MSSKTEMSRITVDIPKETHKKLKTHAALLGKSMRSIILDALELSEECILSDHYPNKETLKTIANIEKGKNLEEVKNLKNLFKKLGL